MLPRSPSLVDVSAGRRSSERSTLFVPACLPTLFSASWITRKIAVSVAAGSRSSPKVSSYSICHPSARKASRWRRTALLRPKSSSAVGLRFAVTRRAPPSARRALAPAGRRGCEGEAHGALEAEVVERRWPEVRDDTARLAHGLAHELGDPREVLAPFFGLGGMVLGEGLQVLGGRRGPLP